MCVFFELKSLKYQAKTRFRKSEFSGSKVNFFGNVEMSKGTSGNLIPALKVSFVYEEYKYDAH